MQDKTKQQDPAVIKLTNVRLSFPNLFKARDYKGDGNFKYSADFILDNERHSALLDHIDNVIASVVPEDFKKKRKNVEHFLHDGNEMSDKEGYGDGVSYVRASRRTRPVVVNRDLTPITEDDGIVYGGCVVNANIRVYWSAGANRVCADLRSVQFVKDDEPFGAAPVNPEDEFDALDGDGADPAPRSNGSTRSQRSTKPAAAAAEENWD